jgi:hypothetical protein
MIKLRKKEFSEIDRLAYYGPILIIPDVIPRLRPEI